MASDWEGGMVSPWPDGPGRPHRPTLPAYPDAEPGPRSTHRVERADSDVTVVFSVAPELTGGSRTTVELAQKHGESLLHLWQQRAPALLEPGRGRPRPRQLQFKAPEQVQKDQAALHELDLVGRDSRRAVVLPALTRLGRSLALPGSRSQRMASGPRRLARSACWLPSSGNARFAC